MGDTLDIVTNLVNTMPDVVSATGSEAIFQEVDQYLRHVVTWMSIICVLFIFGKIGWSAHRNEVTVPKEFEDNIVDYMRLFMFMSSLAAIFTFTAASIQRGNSGGEALLRYTIVGFMEIGAYMVNAKRVTKAVADWKVTKKEWILISSTFLLGVLFTITMNRFYYEANGNYVLKFGNNGGILNYFTNSYTVEVKAPVLDFAVLFLVWSTPIFSLISTFLEYLDMDDNRMAAAMGIVSGKPSSGSGSGRGGTGSGAGSSSGRGSSSGSSSGSSPSSTSSRSSGSSGGSSSGSSSSGSSGGGSSSSSSSGSSGSGGSTGSFPSFD